MVILIVCAFAPEDTLGVHQYDVKLKNLSGFIYVSPPIITLVSLPITRLLLHSHNFNLELNTTQLANIDTILYGIANVLIKSSILLQYITLFSPTEKGHFYWSCHGIMALNLLVYTIMTFIEIFTCKPIAKKWNIFLEGTCMNYQVDKVVSGVINVLSDIIIVVLPQGLIVRLSIFGFP